jgi:type I restriction enzyme S subunit
MATSQDFVNWVCSDALDSRFLKYVLLSEHDSMLRFASGTTHQTIYYPEVKAFHVCLPEPAEQRTIAHILGTLDDKIELNRRTNKTLEAMARALFQSWFVDFDPVRAKHALSNVEGAESRDPCLPKEIADLFPDRFEDSELGEIPAGWEAGAVGDLAEVSSGKRPDVGYPEASVEACVPLWGGNGPMAFVSKSLIDYPILLTGRVGTLGSVFRITSPCWPSDNTLILKATYPRAFEYLFLQLKRVDFASLNRGSTQPLLTQTDLKSQAVLLPPATVLERFHTFVKASYGRIDASEAESRTLAALRDTLLPKLISGELRVQDAETIAEAAI